MEKLKDLMGTKYIYDGIQNDLAVVLKTHKELDLADCYFGPKALTMLNNHRNSLVLRNSADAELDEILQYNSRVKEVEQKMANVQRIPLQLGIVASNEVINYVMSKELDTNAIYTIDEYNSCGDIARAKSIIILMLLKRPDITIDLGIKIQDIFKQVRLDWLTPTVKHHDKYQEVSGNGIIIRDVVDGKVRISCVGVFTEQEYVSKFCVLPYEFGRKDLMKDDEWYYVQDTALQIIKVNKSKKKGLKDLVLKAKYK